MGNPVLVNLISDFYPKITTTLHDYIVIFIGRSLRYRLRLGRAETRSLPSVAYPESPFGRLPGPAMLVYLNQ